MANHNRSREMEIGIFGKCASDSVIEGLSKSETLVQIDALNNAVEFRAGLGAPGIKIIHFFSQVSQSIFLGIKLSCIALHQSLFFTASFQRLHILADAILISGNLITFLLALIKLLINITDFALLR